jgi:dienelactone hydrolase
MHGSALFAAAHGSKSSWEDSMTSNGSIRIALGTALACALLSGTAQAAMKTQITDYKQGDTALSGFFVYDDSVTTKRPGIMLAHDRAGLTEKTHKDAEMLAKLGYVVFAADTFGKGVLPKDVPAMTALTTIYNKDRPLMRARATAGMDVLKASAMVDASKLAVIGYCFGGTVAIEHAETGAPILATISVHGSFRDFVPEAAKNIKSRVLILQGSEDPVAPLTEVNALVEQLRAAKVNWELNVYSGAQHAFTSPQNPSEERADREYKVKVPAFLKEAFGS